MDLGIKNKRALVMGSSTGIGRAIAEALAREGARVALCARNERPLKQAQKELGAPLAIPCDLSEPGAGRILVERVIAEMGGLDILVCNTGGPPKGRFEDLLPEQWMQGFQGLWMSVVDSVRAALPGMKKQRWGRILLVTSAAAREPMPQLNISNGLRAGLMGLTRAVSNEVAGEGITINGILPGFTDTDRLRELKIPAEKITAQIPAGRLARPGELGDLAAFLASERAAYITGQSIPIDGGYLRGL